MPKFRITATVTCSKFVVGVLCSRLRREAKKASRRGTDISLDDLKVKEL